VHPRLLQFSHFTIPTYGVMAALGLVLGLLICVRMARRAGLNQDHAWNLGVLVIFASVLGSKLLLVVDDFGYYMAHPGEIFQLQTLQSGGVWYGGVLLGSLAAIAYMRWKRMPVLKTFDAFAPGIAFGHALGRLGCFAAGCCYGKPTALPWGVTVTDSSAHPTQLYEFAVEMSLFGLLLWLWPRRRWDGQVTGAWMFAYGVARYFLEFLRDDPGRGAVLGGMMTATQLISILMVIGGGLLWLRRSHKAASATA
jgi:phosphatidylglycerol:prolipoprotein diacylglycerol transferase